MNNSIGSIMCLGLGGIFAILALIMTILKEKGAMLISGFNTMTQKQREGYDKGKLSREHRNMFAWWTLLMGIGAAASYFVSWYAAVAAVVIWLILCIKNVHLDAEKAFSKYKKDV